MRINYTIKKTYAEKPPSWVCVNCSPCCWMTGPKTKPTVCYGKECIKSNHETKDPKWCKNIPYHVTCPDEMKKIKLYLSILYGI